MAAEKETEKNVHVNWISSSQSFYDRGTSRLYLLGLKVIGDFFFLFIFFKLFAIFLFAILPMIDSVCQFSFESLLGIMIRIAAEREFQ